MDGLILVRKPEFWTSHDVVAALRKILGQKKIGHFGTLDPLASGLLLSAVGKATRLFPFFGKMNKAYEARVKLGFSTDTYDAEGRPTSPETRAWPDLESVRETLHGYQGKIMQEAPPFSAKKVHGKPLYAYARANTFVETRTFPVTIYVLRLQSYVPPDLDIHVYCSSGTYIRTLAHDLGRQLGCGAHLTGLVRTEVGDFKLEDALSLDAIRAFHDGGQTDGFLRPMESLLVGLPKVVLNEAGAGYVKNGRPVGADHYAAIDPRAADCLQTPESLVRLFDPEGRWIALARPLEPDGATFAPVLVLL
jgi:tRNA pseudouridine55 synthase